AARGGRAGVARRRGRRLPQRRRVQPRVRASLRGPAARLPGAVRAPRGRMMDPAFDRTETAVEPLEARSASARGAVEARPVRPGVVAGRYLARALIGAGGIGRVFAALDTRLGRTVALKLVDRPRIGASQSRTRFLREAEELARVSHPNVVAVLDAGEHDERIFLAMELVEGGTLAGWLRERRRGWREVRDAFVAAGRGLEAAHAAGIVHRDFKPQNVIVGPERVVVLDFGLARAENEDDAVEAVPRP